MSRKKNPPDKNEKESCIERKKILKRNIMVTI